MTPNESLLIAIIASLSAHPYNYRCEPQQVEAMRAEVRQHANEWRARGIEGLVRRTCRRVKK